jgi:small subunit ribosomal protein S20
MPVIKSAKKKLRKDRKREIVNKNLKNLFKKSIKLAEKNPSEANVRKAVKVIDKTAKKNIIHKNKAARIKSKLAKLLVNKKTPAKVPQKAKKTSKAKASKAKAKK